MTAYIDNIIIQGTADEIIQFLEVYKATMSGDMDITVPGGWTFQEETVQYCETCMPNECNCPTAHAEWKWKIP